MSLLIWVPFIDDLQSNFGSANVSVQDLTLGTVKNTSGKIKIINETLKIQEEINTNLQNQLKETEKGKLIEENKKLGEDYNQMLFSFEKILNYYLK